MIKKHYPELFAGEPDLARRADALAAKTYELVSFLTDVLGIERVDARFERAVTYHDSCSGLRELGIQEQPRKLLANGARAHLAEMPRSDVCCGFGGTFAVKYGEISNAIVERKTEDIAASRRAGPAGRRSRLPDEHGGQALARGPRHRGAPRRRSARRHDRCAADRRDRSEDARR